MSWKPVDSDVYIKTVLPCQPEASEAVSDFLFGQGASGVEEQERCMIGYFPGHIDPDRLAQAIRNFIGKLGTIGLYASDPEIHILPVEDWSQGWREYFHAIPVNRTFVVKPPWETWNGPQPVVIDIMPKMAFGTGSHETTQLCLGFIEKMMKPGYRVLDMGTGSGILAIACAKLGGVCLAVDIDEDALENTRENVVMNGVDQQVRIESGSVDIVGEEKFDLVIANINRTVLSRMIPGLLAACHSRSRLILSGILSAEASLVQKILDDLGLQTDETRELGEWTGFLAGL